MYNPERILNSRQVVDILGIDLHTLHQWRREGKISEIKHNKFNNRIIFTCEDLKKILKGLSEKQRNRSLSAVAKLIKNINAESLFLEKEVLSWYK